VIHDEARRRELVRRFISDCVDAGAGPSLVSQRLVAIQHGHTLAGLGAPRDPLLSLALEGLRRERPAQGARGITAGELASYRGVLDFNLAGDRSFFAALCFGFSSMCRHSEYTSAKRGTLSPLRWRHIIVNRAARRLDVTIAKSKTDQRGEGREVSLHASGDAICAF
jgi:hypothetical protein